VRDVVGAPDLAPELVGPDELKGVGEPVELFRASRA
jgi:hypothetical protein